MEKEILENVPEQYKFLLANGKEVRGIKELHGMLKSMEENVFYSHVNESKNDFYNWVKDIYQNKNLADDLLECTTKESILFCLGNYIEKAHLAKGFDEMPQGYSREKSLFDDLPKGYPSQRIVKEVKADFEEPKPITEGKLVAKGKFTAKEKIKSSIKAKSKKTNVNNKTSVKLINVNQVKKNSKMNIKKNGLDSEDADLSNIKKVKPMNSDSIIKKMKEVYGFE